MQNFPQTVIRPIAEADLPDLLKLADQAGLTNLPRDRQALSDKIIMSMSSFQNGTNTSELLGYFFVLEDIASKKIIGCSGIAAAGSYMVPFYHFKLSTVNYVSQELNLSSHHKILTMVNDYQGCTEICSLFLLPEYRKNNNGFLLSRARFLFMADYITRFSKVIIAEMRGVYNEDGSQPFWDNVISKFIDIPFFEADKLTGMGKKQFISDLMPRYPIYTDYLPKSAQEVIDQVHINTAAALEILKREGFRSQGYVDIFDAGPMVECEIDRINSVANSKLMLINKIIASSDMPEMKNRRDNKLFIISNAKLDFRACLGHVIIDKDDKLAITKEIATILNVDINDKIRFISLSL